MTTDRVVRVARDNSKLIVKRGANDYVLVLSSGEQVSSASDLASLASSAGVSWRRTLTTDTTRFADALSVLAGDVVVASADAQKTASARTYRVPPTVRRSISSALESYSSLLSDSDREIATRLATQTAVSRDDIEWMHKFYVNVEKALALHGGRRGQNWAAKALEIAEPVVASAFEYDDSLAYFAVGENPDSTEVTGLYAVDYDDEGEAWDEDDVYQWVPGEGFQILDYGIENLDFPLVIELDEESARALADYLDANAGEIVVPEDGDESSQISYDVSPLALSNLNPIERNLFALAEAEIDWTHIDRLGAIVADATGYSPAERSQNAQRQPRAQGGRFGGAPEPVGDKVQVVAKARLPEGLEPVKDVNKLLDEYLASHQSTASKPVESDENDEPVIAAGIPAGKPEPLYLAIVDPVDQTAVLDVVALVPNDSGDEVDAYIRHDGKWEGSPQTVQDIRGVTPPTVVKLETEDVVKAVLAQVDEHDGETVEDAAEADASGPQTATAIAASAHEFLSTKTREKREKLAKSGYALPDGSFPIENETDLKNAVLASSLAKDSEAVQRHIKKRAAALNRRDLVPAEWSSASLRELFDTSHLSPLYGPHGEIIASVVAAGVPGIADTPSDHAAVSRLREYWTHGEGAAKIRWGTEGDLTRCHRQVTKYVGPERAWGLCQNYHKYLFGVTNAKRDKLAGEG